MIVIACPRHALSYQNLRDESGGGGKPGKSWPSGIYRRGRYWLWDGDVSWNIFCVHHHERRVSPGPGEIYIRSVDEKKAVNSLRGNNESNYGIFRRHLERFYLHLCGSHYKNKC